ncbi:hypothetical protein RSC2_01229 [Bacillus paralicheniformis]|nr:hypothetical protein RSC1_03780 [Bacillus paralicheniformis]BCE09433.1 hypothetical protein RSC2_01229 [Bacillus paralicheniformis]
MVAGAIKWNRDTENEYGGMIDEHQI